MADGSGAALNRLSKSTDPQEQLMLREALRTDSEYLRDLAKAYAINPFLRLTDAEADALSARSDLGSLGGLIAARHAAQRKNTPRHVVFCMPKSGSSFVHSALEHALELPSASLTAFGTGAASSYFGMNPREQELDELAVIKSILAEPRGFVAQHHTRYTRYLGLQIQSYGLSPIVTVRNILDCLVSFDDMMLEWRGKIAPGTEWISDPYALPTDYHTRDQADRYRVLVPVLGTWLIQFFRSWKRCFRQGQLSPLLIEYERHILNPPRFVETVSAALGLSEAQSARLAAYAAAPDRQRARLNVGRSGRGRETIPAESRRFLMDYARAFVGEISDEELRLLLS